MKAALRALLIVSLSLPAGCNDSDSTASRATSTSPSAPAAPSPSTPGSPPPSPTSGPDAEADGGPAAEVHANVTFRKVEAAARVDSRFAGLSYEKSKLAVPMFTAANTPLIELFRLLGPSVLRIGANQVDRATWKGPLDGFLPITPAEIDALAEFLRATSWQVIYGVNLAQNTPENAADEAAYVAARLGPSLLAFEIGNEPDLFVRRGYRPEGWGYNDFLREWRTYRAAMTAASPGVAFSGPATAYDVRRITERFARDIDDLAMLTHHYYRENRDVPGASMDVLLRPDPNLLPEATRLANAATRARLPLGARFDEANTFSRGGLSGVSNAFGSALWVNDFAFTCASAGMTGVSMHGGNRGSYTPIADVDGVVQEVRPEFYGLVLFSKAADGMPLEGVEDNDPRINLTAWGVARDDGGLNVVLLNKDERRAADVTVTTGIAARSFEPLWLTGTALDARTGQTIGGAPIAIDGSWQPQASAALTASEGRIVVRMPPASAVLLRSR